MKRIFLPAITALLPGIAAAQPATMQAKDGAGSRALACDGPLFGAGATHATLADAFGAGNVSFEKQDGPEGQDYMATVLFAKRSAERLVVSWSDTKRRRKPESITAKAGSRWALPNGIAPGSTLAAVEAANGKTFQLSGFEWDYGGFVSEWNGGAMTKALGSCDVVVRFAPGPGGNTGRASGDKTFGSGDPGMKAAKPVVSEITVSRSR